MGKHDIKEIREKDGDKAYYIARIRKLEADVARLDTELREAQHNVAIMTSLYEQSAERLSKNEARSDAIIEQKNDEIEMAKEAIYLAAMREVALR